MIDATVLYAFLVKGALIVTVAGVLSILARRASATRRHVVWLAAIGALALLPLAEIGFPRWNVAVDQVRVVTPLVAPRVFATRHTATRPAPAGLAVSPAQSDATAVAPVARPTVDAAEAIAIAWFVGFGACCARLLLGLLRVRWLVRSGIALPANGRVRVLVCPKLTVPATAGVLRPVILLPAEAAAWDESRLRLVIAHESGHIARRDWLWQILAQLTCAVHFFNPLAWVAAHRMRAESELACDDFVLATGVEPVRYAQTLLDIARNARYQVATTVGMARTPNVEGRLRAIVDGRRRRSVVSARGLAGALAISLMIGLPVAVLHALPGRDQMTRDAMPAPPQIPWVASQEIEPNVFLAKDGVAGLPGGFRVKLVGVGTTFVNQGWDLNLAPLANADRWRPGGQYSQRGNAFHQWYSGVDSVTPFHRSLLVEIESDSDAEVGTTSRITEPAPHTTRQVFHNLSSGGDARFPDVELKANHPKCGIFLLGVNSVVERGTYRFALAGPQWKTEAVVDNPYHGDASGIGKDHASADYTPDSCIVSLTAQPNVFWLDRTGHGHSQNLLGQRKLSSDLAIRAILFDRNGSVIQQPESPTILGEEGYPAIMPNASTFSRIAKIEIQTSPYRWAEFRDVPFQPNYEAELARRMDSGVRGTATGVAPGFSKALPNGATVAISSVSKSVVDHDSWTFIGQPAWRADGAVLKTGPKIDDYPRPLNRWGKLPLVHFVVTFGGKMEGANTTVETTQNAEQPAWERHLWSFTWPTSSDYESAYAANAATGGIRVGVANGAWTLVSRTPVNVASLPDAVDRNAKDTGIAIVLGDEPVMNLLSSRRTAKLSRRPVTGVDVRVVAVLKSGRQVDLTGYRAGSLRIPARHGERFEAYGNILAGDVKAILFETRPFEWVEFKGIALNHK